MSGRTWLLRLAQLVAVAGVVALYVVVVTRGRPTDWVMW